MNFDFFFKIFNNTFYLIKSRVNSTEIETDTGPISLFTMANFFWLHSLYSVFYIYFFEKDPWINSNVILFFLIVSLTLTFWVLYRTRNTMIIEINKIGNLNEKWSKIFTVSYLIIPFIGAFFSLFYFS
jgi:hypothetical protein